jgi:hypothetical protein
VRAIVVAGVGFLKGRVALAAASAATSAAQPTRL